MRPVLFTIADFSFKSYPTAMIIAFLVGIALVLRMAVREGWNFWRSLEGCLFVAFGGLAGARLLYVALTWDFYSLHPERIFKLAFTDSLLRRFFRRIHYRPPLVPLAQDRFLAGLRHGGDQFHPRLRHRQGRRLLPGRLLLRQRHRVYWAVVFPNVDNLYRHPVQLYAAAGALLIFVLLKVLAAAPFNGVYLLYLPMFYGVLRFTTEFFREEPVVWAVDPGPALQPGAGVGGCGDSPGDKRGPDREGATGRKSLQKGR